MLIVLRRDLNAPVTMLSAVYGGSEWDSLEALTMTWTNADFLRFFILSELAFPLAMLTKSVLLDLFLL